MPLWPADQSSHQHAAPVFMPEVKGNAGCSVVRISEGKREEEEKKTNKQLHRRLMLHCFR